MSKFLLGCGLGLSLMLFPLLMFGQQSGSMGQNSGSSMNRFRL